KVAEAGGKPELLYKSGVSFQPEFLPDGRHFFFVETSGIWVGSVDGTDPVKLLPDFSRAVYSPLGFVLFIRQGRLTAQAFDPVSLTLSGDAVPITRESVLNTQVTTKLSAALGKLVYQVLAPDQLEWVDRKGTVVKKIAAPQAWVNFRISFDQTRVAFDVTKPDSTRELRVLDLRRETQERITVDQNIALVPIFSPDGNQIAFTSFSNGRFSPYVANASHQTRMVAEMGTVGGYPVDWSSDGKNLLWWGDEDLWVVPVNG